VQQIVQHRVDEEGSKASSAKGVHRALFGLAALSGIQR
jgi:hypothetical protein